MYSVQRVKACVLGPNAELTLREKLHFVMLMS